MDRKRTEGCKEEGGGIARKIGKALKSREEAVSREGDGGIGGRRGGEEAASTK